MTIEEIGELVWSELTHNRITTYGEYGSLILSQGEDLDYKEDELVDMVDNYLHNKYSFGFCDMCDEFIDYDTDDWYDLCYSDYTEEERDKIEHAVSGTDIQDICGSCFNTIMKGDKC